MYTYSINYLLLSAVLLLPLLLIVNFRSPRKPSGENLLPGPWRLPVIGSLHHLVGALPHHALHDLARMYDAPLMLLRLGELNLVVASSAAAASEIMKTHDVAFASRPRTATIHALTADSLGVAFSPYGEHWRRLRKLYVTELLGTRPVQSHSLKRSREAEAAALVASVVSSSSSSSSEPVNVSSLLDAYVIDVVMRILVGNRTGGLGKEILEHVDDGVKLATRFGLADLFPSSFLARALSRTPRRGKALCHETNLLMDRIVDKHITTSAGAGDEEEENLLDVLLRIQNDVPPLDLRTIGTVIVDLFGAATGSSATVLEWAMSELMRNPAVLRKAQSEVRGAVGITGESRVREEALPELHYLHQVIKETLRLHPPAPLLLPRECREPRRILGYDVPKGAMVLINAWAISRDAEIWGADAKEFRPERFEKAGADAVGFMGTNFEFLPFGAGRRMCPGMAFGLAIVELALASLLFHFDWELPAGCAGGLDMAEEFGITVRRKTDLLLHGTVRVPVPAPNL